MIDCNEWNMRRSVKNFTFNGKHKENKVIEKRKLFSQLVTTCILSPYWKEYKEDYLQMAENSGLDMSSKMFDEMIFSDYFILL